MLFAHMKRILRVNRLRLRARTGAREEFLLTAIAQNLRRLALSTRLLQRVELRGDHHRPEGWRRQVDASEPKYSDIHCAGVGAGQVSR